LAFGDGIVPPRLSGKRASSCLKVARLHDSSYIPIMAVERRLRRPQPYSTVDFDSIIGSKEREAIWRSLPGDMYFARDEEFVRKTRVSLASDMA
jgi:hypothetical protein